MRTYDEPVPGFELINEINEPNLSYEFNTFGIFRKKGTRELFWGTDQGCSCPSPWERHTESNLNPIVRNTYNEFEVAVNEFPADLEDRRRLIDFVRTATSQWDISPTE